MPPTPSHPRPRRSGRTCAALLLAAATAAGCATARPGASGEIRWPLPPETARVQFVRAIKSERDLDAPWAQRFLRVFVPAPPEAVVQEPTGLALSLDEKTLYVACASASKVLAVDLETGRIRLAANEEGRRPTFPLSVAVDAEDNLYVSDPKSECIWVYAPDGKFLRRIANEKLGFPSFIAIDRKGQVLYVVNGVLQKSAAHRVEAFTLKGEPIRTIGRRGHAQGEFNFPNHLTVGPDGRLYVVDMLNFRVQVFDPEGKPVGSFGTIGNNVPGAFDKAKGIALDTFGNIYVVDSLVGWIQVFNQRFQLLMAFGGRASLPGYFTLPTAITIGSRNQIYVADFGVGIVNEYQLVNTTPEDSFLPEEPAGAAPAAPQPQAPPPPTPITSP